METMLAATSSEQLPRELAENLRFFTTPQAIEEYSVYQLFPQEKYLFEKYYKRGESILDLSCGLGRTTLNLNEMGMPVRGIDASRVFIETAKKRFPQLDLRVGNYACIEEPDSSFSHVLISFNGLDYAYPESQREAALRECARVLKSGGTLIYSSHNIKSLHLFSPCYRNRRRWKLRNSLAAFKEWAYLFEKGLYTFFASSEFVIFQTERAGFTFLELVGFGMSADQRIEKYSSPFIHYVFKKL